MLGVMPSKLIKGCNSLQGDENLEYFRLNCQEVMSLNDMLNRQFPTDAHFTCYNLTEFPQWPLLNKSILPEIREQGHDIVLAYMGFDWDNADHAEWTEASMQEFATLMGACTSPIITAWSALYTTKHGARLIYTMSQPVPADEGEKHLAWMFNHFKENGFDKIDENCKDYTRRFRCPQVVRDNVITWDQWYYGSTVQDRILDMNLVGKRSTASIARKTYFIKDRQEQPAFDVLANYLHAKNPETGKPKQTDYFKRAKKCLKNSTYTDILFNDATASWQAGHRNDEIGKMLGHITPVLLREAFASVQQVFALAVQPLLTLDTLPGEDWVKHGWNALLDIYEREVNKHNSEKEMQADKISKEMDDLDKLVVGMKEWCDDPALSQDEDSAREFVKANILVSAQGGFVFALNNEGRYSDFAIQKEQIVSRVRRTYLNGIIRTQKTNFHGEDVDITVASVVNDYATPVAEIQMKPVGGAGGYIEDINGDRPVLVLSTFARNDRLEPTFNPFVNEWLKNLFGDKHYEKGCEWIGNALAFEEGLICALSMEGASAAGKKLLTEGLSECLKVPHIAGPEALYHQSSAFTKTPFLVVNEAWPKIYGDTSPADKFKSLTGGDGIIVNEKYKPAIRVLCPVRLLMTANDDGIIKTLVQGKDMGVENRIAIGERLFHLKVSTKAKIYLESIGGRGFTAKKGSRWIRPDSGSDKSDFVVAKHFLWLHKHRSPVNPAQRFLVMGNCSPGADDGGQNVIANLLADNNSTPLVAQAIIAMIDSRAPGFKQYVRTDTALTTIYVTRYGVHKYVKEVLEERVDEADVFSGMSNLMDSTEPVVFDNMHWYEISPKALTDIATCRGIAQTLVRNIYMNRLEAEAAHV